MDTQCFGTGDSHVEALIQIILFWYRFVDFSLYKYWKIVSCLWLYRGQCCWCIGWNRPKKGFVIHFPFLWLRAIQSCWFFRTCPWKLVFLDGEKNTCHSVERQATETWNISISWCLPPGVPPSPSASLEASCSVATPWLSCLRFATVSTAPMTDCGGHMPTKVHSLSCFWMS